MRFSLLKKGSMVFVLSFLVMSFSLVSFSSVAFAGDHHQDQEYKCKPSAKAIEATETNAGLGGFVIHARCLPASTAFVVTSTLPAGCPSPITAGPAVTISGFDGHIDAFVAFGPSLKCISGNYTIALVEQEPNGLGFVVTIPLKIGCCSSTGADPNLVVG